MSPSNPTGKDSLQVHAARLRELAQEQLDMAKTLTPMYSSGLIATCRADAAALLAGAEALEAVEVAKAALEQIVNNRIGDVGRCGSRHCDCSECVATAALARLEGK
jgi:hypothetical protein